jgi:hypothetical protein
MPKTQVMPLRFLLVIMLGLLSGCRMRSTDSIDATSKAAASVETRPAAEIPTDTSPADLPPLADTALFIDGVTLRVSSVEKASSYKSPSVPEFHSDTPTDALFIVKAELGDASAAAVESWKGQVILLDKTGRSSYPQITETVSSKAGLVQQLTWVFVVSKSAPAFLLKLPAGQSLPLNDISK